MPVQCGRDCPSRTTADRPRGRGRSNTPHLRFKTPADPILEGWFRILHSQGGPPDNPGGEAWCQGIAERHRHTGGRHAAIHAWIPGCWEGRAAGTVPQHRPRVRGINAGWKEMKDTGELCTSNTYLEEEDELTCCGPSTNVGSRQPSPSPQGSVELHGLAQKGSAADHPGVEYCSGDQMEHQRL